MMVTADDVKWVERHDVPVYDSHIIIDRETGEEHHMDRDRLQSIADRMNRRFQQTGEESPIVIGHTKDDVPEWEQPPIVGYAQDFYVSDHPDSKRPFLYARNWKLYPESKVGGEKLTAEEVLRRFPRRSPEVWLTRDEIDPIALLGATTPMRDLGLVRCARPKVEGEEPAVGGGEEKEPKPSEGKSGAGTVDTNKLVAALEALLDLLKNQQAPAPPAPEEQDEFEPGGGGEGLDQSDEPFQYQASMPSSTNDSLPQMGGGGEGGGEGGDDKKQYEAKQGAVCSDPEMEKVKMQRDQNAIQGRTFESRLAALETENKALKEARAKDQLKYQRQVRTGDMKQLLAEGYDLDLSEEVETVADMNEEQYGKYLSRLRKRYSRIPVNEGFIHTGTITEGGEKSTSKEIAERAGAYAAQHGIDYGKALRMAKNGEI